MKKIFLLIGVILINNVANAKTEYYTSLKAGMGDTTIYVDGHDKLGDYLENQTGYRYSDTGLLWEVSASLGFDWSPGEMYVTKNPYDWFHLRLEGEFGYNNYRENGKLRNNYAIADRVKVKYDNFFVLANGYADFRIDRFVPYVGLGIGYSFGNEEVKITGEHELNDANDDDGIIYAVHLGVGYRYSDITTFDLGVRRVYAPAEDDGVYMFDTIRLGARFRI